MPITTPFPALGSVLFSPPRTRRSTKENLANRSFVDLSVLRGYEFRTDSTVMPPCGQHESRFSPEDVRARSSNPEEISSRTSGAWKSEPLLGPFGLVTVYEIQWEGHTVLHRRQFLCTSKSYFRHPGCDCRAEPAPSEHLGCCTKLHDHIAGRLCPSRGFPGVSRSIDSLPLAEGRNVGAAWSIRTGI